MTFNFLDKERLDAVKVQFEEEIFEEDFPERGMIAWLTKIEKVEDCFKLHFDFSEFEEHNKKYFTERYFENVSTRSKGLKKHLYTALEAGCYSPKYFVYFGDIIWTEEKFNEDLNKHLKVISNEKGE